MEYWHLWIAAGFILFIVEIFAPGFVLACLGIGALGAGVTALYTDSLEIQLTVFSVISIICFFLVRPLAVKAFFKDDNFKSNTDVLVGKTAEVSKDFNPSLKRGRVKIDGDDWRAETEIDESLSTGDIVEIIRVESNTLIVTKKSQLK